MRYRSVCLIPLLVGLLAAGGCSKSKGALSGKVALNGEPLEAGQVTAYDAENQVLGISQIVEGNYRFTDLPPGPVTLVVQTYQLDGRPVNGSAPPPREGEKPVPPDVAKEMQKAQPEGSQVVGKPVPAKYTSVRDSDLKTTVEGGSTVYDIHMTGKGVIPRPTFGAPPPPPHAPR